MAFDGHRGRNPAHGHQKMDVAFTQSELMVGLCTEAAGLLEVKGEEVDARGSDVGSSSELLLSDRVAPDNFSLTNLNTSKVVE